MPYDLELLDFSRLPFGLSGLVLTSSQADLLATANPDALLQEALPGSPSASRRFSAAETLTIYAEAYTRSAQAHAVTFVTTVHDAMDGRKMFE